MLISSGTLWTETLLTLPQVEAGSSSPIGILEGFSPCLSEACGMGRAFRSSLALGEGWLLACPLASRVDTFPVSVSPGIIQGPGDRRRVFLFRPLLCQRGFPQEELWRFRGTNVTQTRWLSTLRVCRVLHWLASQALSQARKEAFTTPPLSSGLLHQPGAQFRGAPSPPSCLRYGKPGLASVVCTTELIPLADFPWSKWEGTDKLISQQSCLWNPPFPKPANV